MHDSRNVTLDPHLDVCNVWFMHLHSVKSMLVLCQLERQQLSVQCKLVETRFDDLKMAQHSKSFAQDTAQELQTGSTPQG